jgi:HD-like signal output (HDOD) protein
MNRETERKSVLQAAASLRLTGLNASASSHLIAMLCDETISADELSLRIEREPVLSARVLRIANSAFYGQQRTVTTLRRAVQVLGVNALRGVAAAACIDQVVPSRMAVLPDAAAWLHHSLATALASEMLAGRSAPELSPVAFIAGLLHNLGVLIQTVMNPHGVAAMIAARRANVHRDIRELEQEHSVPSHEKIIGVVFEDWRLPPALVCAAMHHHRPAEAPEESRSLVRLVGTCAHLALVCGNTYSLEPAPAGSDVENGSRGLIILPADYHSGFQAELQRRLGYLAAAAPGK